MVIQPCRPKSESARSGAIWTQFKPKQRNQKAIPAHAGSRLFQAFGPSQPQRRPQGFSLKMGGTGKALALAGHVPRM